MGRIKVTLCNIKGLYMIEPAVFKDKRGYSIETYNQNDLKEVSLGMVFVQDNQSMPVKGVLKELYFQRQYLQDRLVGVARGTVYDVTMDLRSNSETYGKWFDIIPSAENKRQFYVSEEFAHGFLALSDEAELTYKCMDFYRSGDEGGLLWSDPEIEAGWPIKSDMQPVISDKDREWSGLRDTFKL